MPADSELCLTMLSESLENGANAHDDGTSHNAPPTPKALIAVWSDRDRENGTKLVAGGDETEQSGLNGPFALRVLVAITKIFPD